MTDKNKVKYSLHVSGNRDDDRNIWADAGTPPREVFEGYIKRKGIEARDCNSFVRVNGFDVLTSECLPGQSVSLIESRGSTQLIYEVRGLEPLSDDAFDVFAANRLASSRSRLFYKVEEGRQLNERAQAAIDELKAKGLIEEMDVESGQRFDETDLAKSYPWLVRGRSGIPRCFKLTEEIPEPEDAPGCGM